MQPKEGKLKDHQPSRPAILKTAVVKLPYNEHSLTVRNVWMIPQRWYRNMIRILYSRFRSPVFVAGERQEAGCPGAASL